MTNVRVVPEAKPDMHDLWTKEKDPTCLFSQLNFRLHGGFVFIVS